MFKNFVAFKLSPTWSAPTAASVEDKMQMLAFHPIGLTQTEAIGWVPPRKTDGDPMLESIGGEWIGRVRIDTKAVPGSLLRREVTKRCEEITTATGRKPGKKERKEISDEVKQTLLPQMIPKETFVTVWIDRKKGRMVLNNTSSKVTDRVNSFIADTLFGLTPNFGLALLSTKLSASSSMSGWLIEQEPPNGFSIDRSLELRAADESKAVVRYHNHPLDIVQVREHVEQGKLPVSLGMTFNDRVSFKLTDAMHFKGVAMLGSVFDDHEDPKEFDTTVAIWTGELTDVISEVVEALGGQE